MKYFGFIKENDEYKYAVSIKDLINEKNTEHPHRKKVLEYLKKRETLCCLDGMCREC